MNLCSGLSRGATCRWVLSAVMFWCGAQQGAAAPLVPGTGYRITEVGDDFEEEDWKFETHFPKSSTNLDGESRLPIGESTNGRIYESSYRGEPDVVKRVATPPGGLPGSQGALLMRSLYTGIPGVPTREFQQDDLFVNVSTRLGAPLSPAQSPSIVVRVFFPPFDQWEQRTGSSFAVRADLEATSHRDTGRFFRRQMSKVESYWPGLFVQFNCKRDGRDHDSAMLLIRADEMGHDVPGPEITQTGWWTLGMSFTPDGMVHYYASPGVDRLTPADHLGSYTPYGFRTQKFSSFFFNIVNRNDGRTWSTEWVIDDPALYVLHR